MPLGAYLQDEPTSNSAPIIFYPKRATSNKDKTAILQVQNKTEYDFS